MKHIKITTLLLLIIFTIACKYDEKGYSFVREYDKGSYETHASAVKYISGKPDTLIAVRDVYAKIEEKITYVDPKDSILIYGHAWSTNEKIRITDSTATFNFEGKLDKDGNPVPEAYAKLKAGDRFFSVMANLQPETSYYTSSYVITGSIKNGVVTYKDTAFNPKETIVITEAPKDIWEEMYEYPNTSGEGGISFAYKDEIYVGVTRDKFGVDKEILKYSPITGEWTKFIDYPTNASGCVAFVIEHVKVNIGVWSDYLYVGGGYRVNDKGKIEYLKDFYRLTLDKPNNKTWVKMKGGKSEFPGLPRRNAIAFTINNRGYVGLGDTKQGIVLDDLYELDPTKSNAQSPYGTWREVARFKGGDRTGASSFTIKNSAFICGGMDYVEGQGGGKRYNDLWMYRKTDPNGKGAWVRKTSMPGDARAFACGLTIEEFGYVGTGETDNGLVNDFWRYNPFINRWEKIAQFLGVPRKFAIGQGVKYGEDDYRGYVGIGVSDKTDEPGEKNFQKDFYQYRP